MTLQYKKIAIVGMACRFPGNADSPQAYWDILKSGRDVVSQVPESRWGTELYQHPSKKEGGKSYTFAAGVLSQIDQFDAQFFGISPREAEQMDPQQRLLLELTWEALENAGKQPQHVAGSQCAVYIGIASTDYLHRRVDDFCSIDAYSMTGNTASIASNRISYIFDLKGPSVSVDTACSSSLVALHQACQSIWSGEADSAITGGVNMLLHPFCFVGFSKASMLSPTGRCQTFDAAGDGYVRAEGAAIFYLKPLEQAQADGDPIHAVIVGSGINCDGHTNGITVPSSEQQAHLLKTVYARAGVDPSELAYLEAHGTGTAVGDPLETAALGEVLGKPRHATQPLPVGSAKTNVGHLETASGMAGLVKVVLSLKNRALPASLHIKGLNPRIDFQALNLQPVRDFTPLNASDKPLVMGVNSFGFGGANAHVIVQEYVAPAVEALSVSLPPLFLSARTDAALQAQALQYATFLKGMSEQEYYAVAHSAMKHRQPLLHGLMARAEDVTTLTQHLLQFAQQGDAVSVITGQRTAADSPLVWVFSGNGAQWQGMGAALYKESSVFRTAIEDVAALFAQHTTYDLLAEFAQGGESSQLELTEVAQPLLFAVQVATVSVLKAFGVKPDAVIGHSVGEVAAAWTAGLLTLPQAVHVIYERSRAQSFTKGKGRMAAVGLSAEDAQALLIVLGLAQSIEIAGINSPQSVTLSGELAALESVGQALVVQGTFFRLLDLDYAFHSRAMDSTRDALLVALRTVQAQPATSGIEFVSTVTGGAWTQVDADYWWRNIREPVQFNAALQHVIQQGARVFVEVGSHPILRSYVLECLKNNQLTGTVLATNRRKQEALLKLEHTAFSVHLAGCAFDFSGYFPVDTPYVTLPNYPWQRERFWYPLTNEGYDLVNRHRIHPLLGYPLKDADATWENQLDTHAVPYLADHIVDGMVVVPAAAYVEMALAASRVFYKTASHALENLEILAPMLLDESGAKVVRFTLSPSDGSFTIRSRTRLSDETWSVNVVGRLLGAVTKARPADLDVMPLQLAGECIDAATHYLLTEHVGLTYQDAFQGVTQVCVTQNAAVAWLKVPERIQPQFEAYCLHPALLDAGFQILVDVFKTQIASGLQAALIPVQMGSVSVFATDTFSVPAYVQVHIRKHSPRSVVADYVLFDATYHAIAELNGCRFRAVQFNRERGVKPSSYVFEPYLLPRERGLSFPSNAALWSAVEARLATRECDLRRQQHFQQNQPLLDVLVSSYAWQGLRAILADDVTPFTLETLQQAGVQVEYLPLVIALLEVLQDDGFVEPVNTTGWQWVDDADVPSAHDVWFALYQEDATYLPELMRIGRCGEALSRVLTGQAKVEHVLPAANSSLTEHWLESSPSVRAMYEAVQAVVVAIMQARTTNRRVRVLELGGAQASLTRLLLAHLPEAWCDYVFTDFDAERVTVASLELATYPHVQFSHLDRELSNAMSEVFAQGFDVVIANNALWQLSASPLTFSRLRAFLPHSGVLIALETPPERLQVMTDGLNPEWWMPLTTGTQHVPRRFSAEQWKHLLTTAGFNETQAYYEPQSIAQQGMYMLLARAPQYVTGVLPVNATAHWLLVADKTGYSATLAQVLQERLSEYGQTVSISTSYPVSSDDYAHVLHLKGMGLDGGDGIVLQQTRCVELIQWVQTLEIQGTHRPKVWLVTTGAIAHTQPVGAAQRIHPQQAPLWGVGRVLMNEHADLHPVLLDIQTELAVEAAADLLVTECLSPDGEDEILLGNGYRYGMRLRQKSVEAQHPTAVEDVCLDFSTSGLKNLYWKRLPAVNLQAHEIAIRPRATGLNFRDVMYALGLLSDEAVENGFAGASLGMELAGDVIEVGNAVTDFKVGDAVIGFAPACFSTRVVTATTAVAHKPAEWTYEAAATVPATFFTVYYALHHLAQLEAGEKILIHGATGGVGLAALQFARYRGAEIFATAGSDEKRTLARWLGADHVLDSRTLNFADDILALTDGKGVDVVLNSIAGEAINRNLNVLKPFGRFLELGKRDFYENTKIGLRPFRNNIAYYGIDADQLLIEKPALAKRLFAQMMDLFRDGALQPLPHRVFAANRIQDVFRYMQQSRHIGKIVVSFSEAAIQPTYAPALKTTLELSTGSYLVTGGLGGFGLQTARWLVEKGARSLILMSRSGAASAEAQQAVQAFEAQGVQVTACACDVTDSVALKLALDAALKVHPPLHGVFHAATVLNDGLIRTMTADSFFEVLKPKMAGAWNLHTLTQNQPLKYFVVYSSITTHVGNAGQANYVAANQYLETLAGYRRQLGLPATFVAWGPIADVGLLTRHTDVKDALESRLGGAALPSKPALAWLEGLLVTGHVGMALVNWDWRAVQKLMPAARSSKYTEQQRHALSHDTSTQTQDIRSLLAHLTPAEALELIKEGLVDEIGKILRLPREKITLTKPIFDLGMDSLMGMELAMAVEDRFTVKLPVMLLTEGASIEKVAERIATQLTESSVAATQPNEHDTLTTLAAKHGTKLTAEDVAHLTKGLTHQ